MRDYFNKQLEELNNEITNMGYLIKNAISEAVDAFIELDERQAKKVIAGDTEIDHQEKTIENLCMKLLLKQQPVAGDLRQISAALKMITDMERIGDHAADISEIVVTIAENDHKKHPAHIKIMASETIQMLSDCINAYIDKDLVLAKQVINQDDVVDDLFNKVKEDIVENIKKADKNSDLMADYLMVAKYLERIGDHACNISEWVIFSITGEHDENFT